MGATPAFAQRAAMVEVFDADAVWRSIPVDVRAMLVMILQESMGGARVSPMLSCQVRWSEMSRVEQDLAGVLVRSFGRACQGDALRLGVVH